MVLIWWFHIHPCQFLHLHIVPVMYIESRKMARWSSSTPLQWERPPADLIILIIPCPMHKFSDSHPQRQSLLLSVCPCSRYVVYMFSFKIVELFKVQGYRFSITIAAKCCKVSKHAVERVWYWNLQVTLLSRKFISMPINSLNCNRSFAVMICAILICGNFVMQLINHLYLIAAKD